MSMDLAKKTFSTEPDYLIASTAEVVTAVKTASTTLTRATVVSLDASGELVGVSVTESSGVYTTDTDTIYGILAEDALADEEAIVYLSGEFFADKVTMTANADSAAVEIALRKMGIYLK